MPIDRRGLLVGGGTTIVGGGQSAWPVQSTPSDFRQARSGSIKRSTQEKLSEWVSVLDFGARGDGRADDTQAIQAAFDSGSTHVLIPSGTYAVSGVRVKSDSPLREIATSGFPILRLIAGADAVALRVDKQQFLHVGDLCYSSMGSKTDFARTVGLQINQRSYMRFGHQRFEDFSGAGMRVTQGVYVHIDELTALNCQRAASFEADVAGNPSVHLSIGRGYLSGCTRGLDANTAVNAKVGELVLEYCGSSSQAEGALHLTNSRVQVDMLYCEQNERNMVLNDSVLQLGASYVLPGRAADVITYRDLRFEDRGIVSLGYSYISAPRILPDAVTQTDLRIGENLVVPVGGGSVRWGPYAVEHRKGRAIRSSWTTIKELQGQAGDGSARMSYRYEVYVGRSDRTVGYDKGSILNGQIYSDTHSNPSWLQISGSRLQVKTDLPGYGLDWGLTLLSAGPIG